MQGTAPSYGSGWQGLSAMDMYSQAAHPLCTPFISSTLNPVGSLPPFGSLSGGSDARLPAPWFSGLSMPTSSSADYLQHIQNGISSYLPHKWSEQSSHLGDKAYAVENHSNLFQNTRTPSSTLDLHLNTDNLIYSTTKLPSLPAKSNKFQSVLEEKSFEAFEKRQNSFDFIPYENSTSCSTSLPNTSMAPMLISSRPQELPSYSASSETKYKNAIFSKLSGMENATSSREQMLYKDAGYVTTSSVPSFSKPVNNTHHSKVISYYSDPREKDLFNNTSSNEKASIEAARIVQEAHDSDMNFKHQAATNRAITSPFMNISNQHRQQIPSFKSTDLQNTARAFHHPLPESHISKKSTHSASFRPENLISGNHERPPSVNITSVETDFWSQFGLPPPNVEIKTPSAARSTITSEATSVSGNSLNFADKSSKPAKKKNKTTTEHNEQTNENGALRQMIESKRKSPKSDNRRGIFVPNPEIDALVHAKVHEIMAAVRQKEHSGNEDDNKGCKSKSENPEATRPQVATSMFQSDSKSIINDKYLGFQRDSTNSDVFFVEDRERENSTKHELFTQHTSVSSRELQEKKYLFDTVQDIMEKKKHSSVNREPAEKKNMSDSQVSHNKNQSGTTLQYVNHSIEAMIKPLTTPHDGYMDSSPMKKLNRQVNSMRKVKQEHGRFTPCCGNCEKVGVMFSENCQHFKCYDRKLSGIQAENKAQDPYAFSDEFSDFKPPLTGYKFLNNSYQKPEDSHFKYYQPAQTIDLPKSEVKYSGSYLHAHRKDIKEDVNVAQQKINSFKSDKSHFKSTKPSFKLEKPLNQKLSNHLLKKNNVPYGIKSSNALLKRSKLHGKLPTVRQKWRNNPKYMARHKDDTDFAKKLMKNLGFPPLTLEDLVTKSKKLTLPKSYFSGSKSSIASSVLHAEHKIESRDRVSPKTPDNSVLAYQLLSLNNDKSSFTGNERQEHFQTSAMPRSTHLESCINTTESATPLLTSRSHSFENPRHCFYDDTDKISQTDLKIGVDNNMPQSFANVDIHQMSSHIDQLKEKLIGRQKCLENNLLIEGPTCDCLGPDAVYNEAVEGPYYVHLGSGRSVEAIRKTLELRVHVSGRALRIEKVRYTGKEGKSSQGCPIAKWIVRRSSMEEKYLAIVRHRSGHSCATAWIIVALVAWEGVPAAQADELYDYLCTTLPAYGNETERRCGTNDRKTCACQGADLMKRGASFSFGCSWSMYFNGCKYARSSHVRKFKLKNEQEEKVLEDKLQDLATNVGPLYQQCAPEAYGNQTYLSKQGQDCRLGKEPGGPFSGVTACVDFCAHAHKDIHNMNNGSTVVVTLTKHRGLSKPDDEQLHVLPLHVLEPTDEMGSYEGQFEKIQNGGLEVLHQYPLEARLRAHPLESCRKRKLAKKGMGRGGPKSVQSAMDPSSAKPGQQKNGESVKQETIIQQPPHSHNGLPLGYMHDSRDKPISYEDLMALSAHTEFNALYDKFWDYFYVFGVFPPPSVLAQCINNMDTSAGHTLQNGNKGISAQQEENSQFSNSPQDVPGQFRNERHSVPSNMHNLPITHQYEQMLPQSEQTGKNQGSFCDQPSSHHQQTERNGYMNVPKSQFDINVKPVQAHSNSSIPSQFSGDHQQVDNCPLNLSNDRRLSSALPNDGCALDLSFSSTTSLSSNKGRNWDSKNGTDGAKDTLSPLDLLSKAVDLRTSDLASFGCSAPALASQVNHEAHAFYTSAYKQGENAAERSLEKLPQPFGNSRSQNASAQPHHTSFPQNAGACHHPQLPQSAPPVYGLHNQHQMTIEHHLSSTNTQKMDQNKPLPDMQFQISGSIPQDKAQENLPSYIDPDVVKCEMEYNEEAFHDPEIGGVAIALSHGSVLFEVAKRELHATTGLRNPNRYHPTRISLVFYQHKHMNHEHHGMYAYDKKLQSLQMKRIEKMQLEQGYVDMDVIENSIKGGKKRYLSREDVAEEAEIAELLQRSNTKYQYMLDCSTVRTETSTTCSVSTKWIDPSPTVTGPYHKWV